jgi:hypothetical protein
MIHNAVSSLLYVTLLLLAFASGTTFGADADHGSILAQRWCASLPHCFKCSTEQKKAPRAVATGRAQAANNAGLRPQINHLG